MLFSESIMMKCTVYFSLKMHYVPVLIVVSIIIVTIFSPNFVLCWFYFQSIVLWALTKCMEETFVSVTIKPVCMLV